MVRHCGEASALALQAGWSRLRRDSKLDASAPRAREKALLHTLASAPNQKQYRLAYNYQCSVPIGCHAACLFCGEQTRRQSAKLLPSQPMPSDAGDQSRWLRFPTTPPCAFSSFVPKGTKGPRTTSRGGGQGRDGPDGRQSAQRSAMHESAACGPRLVIWGGGRNFSSCTRRDTFCD